MPDDERPEEENVIRMQPKPKRRPFKATLIQVGRLLRSEPDLFAGAMFKLDLFSGETMLVERVPRPGVEPPPGLHRPRPTTDIDVTHLIEWIEANGVSGKVSRSIVDAAIQAEGHRNAFSSARQAFDALPVWDGVYRLDSFWERFCGAVVAEEGMDDDAIPRRQRYLKATARCFFIGIVARVLTTKPEGEKVDSMVILEGPQGGLKSTLLRVMAFERGDWFSDSMVADLRNKDARAHLAGKLIIELAEMSQLTGTKAETMKAFLSAQDDKFRPSYGRRDVTHIRQCVFVGTTNADDYLVDPTGNRRFWPIKCGKIDIAKAKAEIKQVYAEALIAYRAQEPWWLPDDVEVIAAEEQRARLTDDPWEAGAKEAVARAKRAATAHSEPWCWVTTTDVLETIKAKREDWTRAMQMRAGLLLVKLGGHRHKLPLGHREFPSRGYRFDLLKVA